MPLMILLGKAEIDGKIRRRLQVIRCDAAVAFAVRDEGGDRVGAWYASVGEDMPATVVARGLIRMEADEMVTAAISHEKAKAEWAKLKEGKE